VHARADPLRRPGGITHRGEVGEPATDDDLREWGIDPDEVGTPDAFWFDEE
jgi:hypothetical protein